MSYKFNPRLLHFNNGQECRMLNLMKWYVITSQQMGASEKSLIIKFHPEIIHLREMIPGAEAFRLTVFSSPLRRPLSYSSCSRREMVGMGVGCMKMGVHSSCIAKRSHYYHVMKSLPLYGFNMEMVRIACRITICASLTNLRL